MEFLIIDLIKISSLEKDITFSKPIITLMLISKGIYSLDISTHIQEFYNALMQNKIAAARIYLDIIQKISESEHSCNITANLYQALEVLETKINFSETSEKVVADEKIVSPPIVVQSAEKIEQDIALEQNQTIIPVTISSQQENASEKEILSQKYQQLVKRKGIMLLNPMEQERINRLTTLIEEYPDMDFFVIEMNHQKQIVLRYKPVQKKYVNIKDLVDLGYKEYQSKNYEKFISVFLQVLQISKKHNRMTYAKIGLSYIKMDQIPLAIEYLTLANYFAELQKSPLDFSSLIQTLKGEIDAEDMKPRVKISEEEFEDNQIEQLTGLENFDQIDHFILESGLDVENACRQLGMTEEQTNVIKLVYAREYYMQGYFEAGDLFLKSVERSCHKIKEINMLLEEIKKTKKFYQNRLPENPRMLTLTLLPSKK